MSYQWLACGLSHRCGAAMHGTHGGAPLDQRRQAFDEQYRDADAEDDAQYA